MMMRLFSLTVSVLLLAACGSSQAIYTRSGDALLNTATSLDDLARISDLIVTGSVVRSGDTWNIARASDPTKPSTTNVVLAENFDVAVDATLKGKASDVVTIAVPRAWGMVGYTPTPDANWTPPSVGTRYLFFLARIPGTDVYGIPAEPFRFVLDGNAYPESRWHDAARYYPPTPSADFLKAVRAAALH